MTYFPNPLESNERHTNAKPTRDTADLSNYTSTVQDGFFGQALRLLGRERMLRYLGAYPHEILPKSLLTIRTQLAGQIPPVHRIPVEILGEIFTHYAHSPRQKNDPMPRLSTDFLSDGNPFILGQVCGLWRHIVTTMPTLWQSLCVNQPTNGCAQLVDLWLQRARDHPLTIQLFEGCDTPKHNRKAMHVIIHLVIRRIRYWKHINFRVLNNHQRLFAALPIGHALSLQHAEVKTASWDYQNGDAMWRALHSSPALTCVKWGTVYSDIDQLPDHIPWAQLTDITLLMTLTSPSVLRVLQACKNIETLDISSLCYSSDSPCDSPVVLPNLHTLTIRAHEDPGHFLRGLILPNLTSLSIDHCAGDFATTPGHVSRSFRIFMEQSSCRLKSFRFYHMTIHESDLLEYMTCPSMASLTDINLCATLTDLTISKLTIDNGTRQLLPKLKRIHFYGCRTTPGVFSGMIASRLSSLEAVYVKFYSQFNDYTQDRITLQAMRRPDLIIRVPGRWTRVS